MNSPFFLQKVVSFFGIIIVSGCAILPSPTPLTPPPTTAPKTLPPTWTEQPIRDLDPNLDRGAYPDHNSYPFRHIHLYTYHRYCNYFQSNPNAHRKHPDTHPALLFPKESAANG